MAVPERAQSVEGYTRSDYIFCMCVFKQFLQGKKLNTTHALVYTSMMASARLEWPPAEWLAVHVSGDKGAVAHDDDDAGDAAGGDGGGGVEDAYDEEGSDIVNGMDNVVMTEVTIDGDDGGDASLTTATAAPVEDPMAEYAAAAVANFYATACPPAGGNIEPPTPARATPGKKKTKGGKKSPAAAKKGGKKTTPPKKTAAGGRKKAAEEEEESKEAELDD